MTTTEIPSRADDTAAAVTVSEWPLRAMLADLLVTAAREDDHPVLCGVVLHTAERDGEPVLVGTSTDRYVAAQAHLRMVSPGGALSRPVAIAASEVRAIVRCLCDDGNQDYDGGTVSIRLEGNWLVLTRVPLSDALGRIEFTVGVGDAGQFPQNFGMVLAGPEGGSQPGPVHLMPEVLSKLAEVASRRGGITVTCFGHDQGVLVQMGSGYRALAMPGRPTISGIALAPVFNLPSAS